MAGIIESEARENKGTERKTRGVGWDMSGISLNLFLDIV